MNTGIRKIIAAIGLAALCFSPTYAGSFSQNVTSGSGGGSWYGTVNVPSVANCTQYLYGGNNGYLGYWRTTDTYAITTAEGSIAYVINDITYVQSQQASMVSVSGPLGNRVIIGNTQYTAQGSIPAGTYNIVLLVQNGGTAVVGISW